MSDDIWRDRPPWGVANRVWDGSIGAFCYLCDWHSNPCEYARDAAALLAIHVDTDTHRRIVGSVHDG